jgi:hypothetical protein
LLEKGTRGIKKNSNHVVLLAENTEAGQAEVNRQRPVDSRHVKALHKPL